MLVSKDEGVRAGTTAAKLGGLKAVFKKGGSTTAGNASQVRLARATLRWSCSRVVVRSSARAWRNVADGVRGVRRRQQHER